MAVKMLFSHIKYLHLTEQRLFGGRFLKAASDVSEAAGLMVTRAAFPTSGFGPSPVYDTAGIWGMNQ